jgi:FG-GAP-like repeat
MFCWLRIRRITKHVDIEWACDRLSRGLLNVTLCLVMCFRLGAQAPVSHSVATSISGDAMAIAVPALPHAFLVRSYLGIRNNANTSGVPAAECLDYGNQPSAFSAASSLVFLNDCNLAHPITVMELSNGRHEVILVAGKSVIGIPRIQVAQTAAGAASNALASLAAEVPLRLFNPLLFLTGTIDAVFALDGDSIILASTRCQALSRLGCARRPAQSVVKLQRARSNPGTLLVVGARNLADSEFWDFQATDGSDADPTSGFVRVTDKNSLLIAMYQINQIAQRSNGAAWGSVIKIINTGEPIDMSLTPASVDPGGGIDNIHNLVVPTGVTIRGDRGGTNAGPLLLGRYNQEDPQPGTRMLQIDGDYVRITGLRLEGPSGNEDTWHDTIGILVGDPLFAQQQPYQTIIDRNEIFDWPTDAVMPIAGSSDQDCWYGQPGTFNSDTGSFAPGLIGSLQAAIITRNFIHDNQESGYGYGVSVSYGAGATILGNVFSYDRHVVTADDHTGDNYSAWDNLVLSQRPVYCGLIICKPEQDFDVHGTLSLNGQQHDGGFGGYNAEIAWNTFIGGGNPNFDLRGQPCREPDSFHNNNSGVDADDAFEIWDYFGQKYSTTSSNSQLTIADNTWKSPDPTVQMGVGDFDGDGRDDLFLATGTTWFYSPGATTEWRYLNGGKTDKIQSLLLGDLNGDGRTDVVGMNGSNLMVSWGGISDWEVLNTIPGVSLSDMAVGDFDGDGRADILFADGVNWFVSSGGSGPFQFVNTSSFRVANLRFGHFQICGSGDETDVFGIVSGKWQVTCGARNDWIPLPISLTDDLTNLFVADFDGDGNADIAVASKPNASGGQLTRWPWQFSHSGAEAFTTNIVSPTASCPDLADAPADRLLAGIGRFGGNRSSDLLIWGGNKICIIPAGIDEAQLQSRQLMR